MFVAVVVVGGGVLALVAVAAVVVAVLVVVVVGGGVAGWCCAKWAPTICRFHSKYAVVTIALNVDVVTLEQMQLLPLL